MCCLVCLQKIYPDAVTRHKEEEGLSMLKVALRGLDRVGGSERVGPDEQGQFCPWGT